MRRNPVTKHAEFLVERRARELQRAIADTAEPIARERLDALIEDGWRYAKNSWEKRNNRVLPHSDWPSVKVAAIEAMIGLVRCGALQR